jgi:hypothetical protein
MKAAKQTGTSTPQLIADQYSKIRNQPLACMSTQMMEVLSLCLHDPESWEKSVRRRENWLTESFSTRRGALEYEITSATNTELPEPKSCYSIEVPEGVPFEFGSTARTLVSSDEIGGIAGAVFFHLQSTHGTKTVADLATSASRLSWRRWNVGGPIDENHATAFATVFNGMASAVIYEKDSISKGRFGDYSIVIASLNSEEGRQLLTNPIGSLGCELKAAYFVHLSCFENSPLQQLFDFLEQEHSMNNNLSFPVRIEKTASRRGR